jgi:hypothetical protein
MEASGVPVIEGWFTTGEEPALLGKRCGACGTYVFPPLAASCPNPACGAADLELVPLSRTGRIWSYTDAHYQPPAPYVSVSDPYVPFAIAAVELEREQMVVLGQVADGYGTSDLAVGDEVELVLEPLDVRDGTPLLVWRWRPAASRVEP